MRCSINAFDEDAFAARILRRELLEVPRSQLQSSVEGRVVLITGAGGFIGSALSRLLAVLYPKRLILCDNSEHALYEIDRKIHASFPDLSIRSVFCDIRDRAALNNVFAAERPSVVLHAAALKHLPLAELNPREAVLTNVIGTANLVECAKLNGTDTLVHISTDKAAAPTSLLGMTKRAAELVCQITEEASSRHRFSSVRFNNVFGSTGSVVPLFVAQIAKGEKLSITHPKMNRYFISPIEAAQLIIMVLGLSQTEDVQRFPVFVLDAGEPLSIMDLAQRIVGDAGQEWSPDNIVMTGQRAGEKLDESLVAPWETKIPTTHKLVSLAADESAKVGEVPAMLDRLQKACDEFDESRLKSALQEYCTS